MSVNDKWKLVPHFWLALLLMAGCGKSIAPRHVVILLDVSASIRPEAEEDASSAIDSLGPQMHHGDSVAVIPIKSDAETETEGGIIRHTVPTAREGYDQEIRRFTTELHASLGKLKADALAHPGEKTDILGALDLALQEIDNPKQGERIILIVLSDFIQEDNHINFKTDPALATVATAQILAKRIAQEKHFSLEHARVFLGGIRSGELAALDAERRKAIQAFWIQYFISLGATPQYATDGPGLLNRFVQRGSR